MSPNPKYAIFEAWRPHLDRIIKPTDVDTSLEIDGVSITFQLTPKVANILFDARKLATIARVLHAKRHGNFTIRIPIKDALAVRVVGGKPVILVRGRLHPLARKIFHAPTS